MSNWSKICSMVKNLKNLENVVYENCSDHDELGKVLKMVNTKLLILQTQIKFYLNYATL